MTQAAKAPPKSSPGIQTPIAKRSKRTRPKTPFVRRLFPEEVKEEEIPDSEEDL
jgi:hypothetical protein